jgi:[ribosomal protein S5]-alanine N-acetyltransferase
MSDATRLPPSITTARLVLRHTRASDADAVFAYASDPDVTLHMDWATHTDVSQSRAFLAHTETERLAGAEALWAITLAGDDRLIGVIAVRPHGHKADFGYVIARAHWGRGIATEAARAVIDATFRLPEVTRVWATCSIDNVGSRRVLEKAGLDREGILRAWSVRPQKNGIAEDSYCYSIVRPGGGGLMRNQTP